MTCHPTTKANAVMFLRARHLTAQGRDRDSEDHAIARQRWACQQAAARLEATVIREYVEYGGTGPIASRPVVRRMLGDLHVFLGICYVLVASLDRLARQPRDLRDLEQQIQATGANLLGVSTPPVVAYHCNPDESLSGLAMTD